MTETGLPLVYVNQVGGQDELVFDGGSFAMNADCGLGAAQLPMFERGRGGHRVGARGRRPGMALRRGPPDAAAGGRWRRSTAPSCWACATTSNKNGFPGVVLGLSGGIDSALSAAVAADALGPQRVRALMMPSPYTSRDSLEDAAEPAPALLGIALDEIGIEPAMGAFEAMLRPLFDGLPADTTEENVQARARGLTLMAVSNKLGHMVLSTGNKSEMSVGYATLYGDMCGGYNVLKDVYKTAVYELARWRNQEHPGGALGPGGRVIPERIITKAPTAELRPDQTDQDSLPPYECPRRHPGRPHRARDGGRGDRRPRPPDGRDRQPGLAHAGESPSTSAARRRRGSRSPAAPSAATAAIPSPTPSRGRSDWHELRWALRRDR